MAQPQLVHQQRLCIRVALVCDGLWVGGCTLVAAQSRIGTRVVVQIWGSVEQGGTMHAQSTVLAAAISVCPSYHSPCAYYAGVHTPHHTSRYPFQQHETITANLCPSFECSSVHTTPPLGVQHI